MLGYDFRGTHAIVSFISASGCLAAAAGLVTPLRTCPVDRVAPSLGLRHGQAPNARPPAGKSGTLPKVPSMRSQGTTYRIGVGDGMWWHDPWAQWQAT